MSLSAYFDSNITLLKLTAFWIYDPQTPSVQKYKQHVYNFFWHLYVFAWYEPFEVLYVYYSFDDLSVFLRALRDIGNHVSLMYKAFNFFVKRKDLLQLIDTLTTKCEFEENDGFHPETIIKAEKQHALTWTRNFLYFCNAICLSMFFNGLFTFIFKSEHQYVTKSDVRIYHQEQPVNIVSPFGVDTKPKFFVTFLFTMIPLTFYAWMIVALDSLFVTLMSCISAHLRILEGAFKSLRSRCMKRLKIDDKSMLHDPERLQIEMNAEMIRCVKQLQTIFRVSKKIEEIYSTQTFVQTFISLGEMCFSLYLLSETSNLSVGNEITYLIATGFELLMYCWFGNRITEASFAVSYALYDSDWFSTNLSFRKYMILTMTRMQKPIYVTIGKITPLTFNTFLMICRGAYSFFTFLKQRH